MPPFDTAGTRTRVMAHNKNKFFVIISELKFVWIPSKMEIWRANQGGHRIADEHRRFLKRILAPSPILPTKN